MIDVSPDSNRNQFRRRRVELLVELANEVVAQNGSCKIIDIGGTRGFWHVWKNNLPVENVTVTCVNMDIGHADYGDVDSRINVITGDARSLSFATDFEYDIAFSNSVIEHVGIWRDMRAMAAEVHRVSPRFIIQTPNYWFPIEPHARTPFLHWLPEPIRHRIVMSRKCGFWRKAKTKSEAVEIVQSAFILDYGQMRELFPDAEIIRERAFGITKSIIAIKR